MEKHFRKPGIQGFRIQTHSRADGPKGTQQNENAGSWKLSPEHRRRQEEPQEEGMQQALWGHRGTVTKERTKHTRKWSSGA